MSANDNGEEYLWCLHCHRAYKRGEYRWQPSQWSAEDTVVFREEQVEQDVQLETIVLCAFPDCDGDVEWDGIPWEEIRKSHAELPEVPQRDCVYL